MISALTRAAGRAAARLGIVLWGASPQIALALDGAEVARPGDWPEVVQVGLSCTGTLIAPDVVAYAAHCGDSPGTIRAGPFEDGSYRVHSTRTCVVHPDGGPGSQWDIAFCILEEPVGNVRPASLASADIEGVVNVGTALSAVALGVTRNDRTFGVKRAGTVTVRTLGPWLTVEGPATACEGDSGGPVFLSAAPNPDGQRRPSVLLGVLSATASQSCDAAPARAVSVMRVRNWLDAEVAARRPPPVATPARAAPLRGTAIVALGTLLAFSGLLGLLAWWRPMRTRRARRPPGLRGGPPLA